MAIKNNITKEEILNSIKPISKEITLLIKSKERTYKVTRKGVGHLITKFGVFFLYNFHINDRWKNYNVLVKSDMGKNFQPIFNGEVLNVRIDSGCLTGHIYDDQTCECRGQMFESMKEISEVGGMIICIPNQDGRGMGIPFKLAALSLQYCFGLNTVDAAKMVSNGKKIDKRDYFGAVAILKFFEINNKTKIDLLTNNPEKIDVFVKNKYFTVERHKIVIKANKYTKKHLLAKQKYLGHIDLIEK